MSQINDLPRSDENRPEVNPTGPDGTGDDVLESNTGVGIGADDEPNTFEPEEDPA